MAERNTIETHYAQSGNDIAARILAAGFAVDILTENVQRPGPDIDAEIEKAAAEPLPEHGIGILVGGGFRERAVNSLRSSRDLRVSRIDILARKPA